MTLATARTSRVFFSVTTTAKSRARGPPRQRRRDEHHERKGGELIITLERIPAPEDLGPTECAICTTEYEQGAVLAWAVTERGGEMGAVCPGCVEYMGGHPSGAGRFPSIEECRRLEAEWRTPAYASGDEADRALGYIE
jgi:hypothetical protein